MGDNFFLPKLVFGSNTFSYKAFWAWIVFESKKILDLIILTKTTTTITTTPTTTLMGFDTIEINLVYFVKSQLS